MSIFNMLIFYRSSRRHPEICVSSYRKNFPGTQKRVRVSHGQRDMMVIGVRIIEVSLYIVGEHGVCIK